MGTETGLSGWLLDGLLCRRSIRIGVMYIRYYYFGMTPRLKEFEEIELRVVIVSETASLSIVNMVIFSLRSIFVRS